MSFTQHINPTDEDKLARNHGLSIYLTTDRIKLLETHCCLLRYILLHSHFIFDAVFFYSLVHGSVFNFFPWFYQLLLTLNIYVIFILILTLHQFHSIIAIHYCHIIVNQTFEWASDYLPPWVFWSSTRKNAFNRRATTSIDNLKFYWTHGKGPCFMCNKANTANSIVHRSGVQLGLYWVKYARLLILAAHDVIIGYEHFGQLWDYYLEVILILLSDKCI